MELFEKEDKKLTMLSKTSEQYDSQYGSPGKHSELSESQIKEYRNYFSKLTFIPVLWRDKKTGNILIKVASEGYLGTDREIGYAYIYSIDESRNSDFINMDLKKLEDNWYIYTMDI